MKRLRPQRVGIAHAALFVATGFSLGLVSALAVALPSRLRRKETPERAENGPIA